MFFVPLIACFAPDIAFFTDNCLRVVFPALSFIIRLSRHIYCLKLLAVDVDVKLCVHQFAGLKVKLNFDDQAVVAIINTSET